jgi:hypothetical protein
MDMKSKPKKTGYDIYSRLIGTLEGHEDMLLRSAELHPDAPEFQKAAKRLAKARKALLKVVEFYDDEPTDSAVAGRSAGL